MNEWIAIIRIQQISIGCSLKAVVQVKREHNMTSLDQTEQKNKEQMQQKEWQRINIRACT